MLLRIESKKDIPTISFFIIWLFVIGGSFSNIYDNLVSKMNVTNAFYLGLIIIVCILSIKYLAWALTGKVIINIENSFCKINYFFLGFSINKIYEIKYIKNVRIEKNVNSNDYWGITGIRFYSNESNLLCFDYNSKKIRIGLGLAEFDILKLEKELVTLIKL